MNYEKLSRALRYYKKVGIIEKAAGKRLTYKYVFFSSLSNLSCKAGKKKEKENEKEASVELILYSAVF